MIVFRDLNKINGLSVFTLNLRPGVIIYQLVMSHLYTECGWCRPGFTADIPPPWSGTNTKTYLTPQRPGIDGHKMSRCPHFIRLLIIKTVFCPNLKFRQLGTLPTPREPQELTASDQIRDNRDDVMKQRDAA